MMMSSARFARMFFGCNERVLASNRSGGTGEKPMAVSSSKTAHEHIFGLAQKANRAVAQASCLLGLISQNRRAPNLSNCQARCPPAPQTRCLCYGDHP